MNFQSAERKCIGDLPKLQQNNSLSPRISQITEKVVYEGKKWQKVVH